KAFGHDISPALRHDIARLASAIERIDRRIDEASDDEERLRRWAHVVSLLGDRGGSKNRPDDSASAWQASTLPSELAQATWDLRTLAIERNVLARVRRIVRDEARTSESIRAATSIQPFLRCVEHEGRLTAALALAIAGQERKRMPADFRRF